MGAIWRHGAYAWRGLRRSPGFALTVVLVLALGVAANTVALSLLEGLVLRPLRLPEAERLLFWNTVEHGGHAWPSFSYPDYRDLRDRTGKSFEGLAAYRVNPMGIGWAGEVERRWGMEVTGNYFDVLRVKPALGRFWHESDIHGEGGSPYIVLDWGFWKRGFAGDPSVVGRTVKINKHLFTVLGVAPASFSGTELFMHPDVWVPASQMKDVEGWSSLERRADGNFWLIARVRPGVSLPEAQGDANRVAQQMAREHKEDEGLEIKLGRPGFVGEMLGGPVRAFLWGLLGLAALLLLAACANLGTLFAARAAERAREVAVRLALGARRRTIAGQLVAEALLVSLPGGALGVALAGLLVRGINLWRPSVEFPAQLSVTIGAGAVCVAVALATVCGVFFGLLPLPGVARMDPYGVIKAGTTSSEQSGRRRWTLRDGLLLLEISACSLLVTASLVAVRGLERTLHTSFGFQPKNVTLARVDLKMAGYPDVEAYGWERDALGRIAALPGVKAAAFAETVPLSMSISTTGIYRDGTTDFSPGNKAAQANYFEISPGYFAAAGTTLRAGRDLLWSDGPNTPAVAVVNSRFVRQVLGARVSDAEAIGRYFLRGDKRLQIVGVAQDGKYESLTEDPTASIFLPISQSPEAYVEMVVRGGDPQAIRGVLHGMDAHLPVIIASWEQELGLALFPAVAATLALGVMGALAAMLAITGIFGTAQGAVTERLRELGIRVALGAGRRQVLRAALRRTAWLMAGGSLAGLALGAAGSKLLASLVYGASSNDPLVLLGVVVAMSVVALVAGWLPAERAMRADPSLLMKEG